MSKESRGTCELSSHPHAKGDHLGTCNKWRAYPPLAKPDESGRERVREFLKGKLAESVNPLGADDPERFVTWLDEFSESIKREAVRETVERCYKLSCHYCAENAEATFLFGAWRHLTKETSRGIPCTASAIRSAFEKGE